MTNRQDPGIGGVRDPKHEMAQGMHKAQRHEIGPDGERRPRDPLGPGYRKPLLISASVGLIVFLVWELAVYSLLFSDSGIEATLLSLSLALNGALITWIVLTPRRTES